MHAHNRTVVQRSWLLFCLPSCVVQGDLPPAQACLARRRFLFELVSHAKMHSNESQSALVVDRSPSRTSRSAVAVIVRWLKTSCRQQCSSETLHREVPLR
jgi:hypothetical protein